MPYNFAIGYLLTKFENAIKTNSSKAILLAEYKTILL